MAAGAAQDARALHWETIDDFRPGIVSQANFGYGASDGLVPAPANLVGKAAAQPAGTFGCIALPGGGLGPLPGVKELVGGPAGLAGTRHINGAFVVPNVNGADELVFGLEAVIAGVRGFDLLSWQDFDATLTIIKSLGPEATVATGIAPITGGLTRVNVATPTDPGNPCLALVYEWLGTGSGPQAYNWLYPDPTAPGSFVPYAMANPQNGNGVCYDNRILVLTVDNYEWTAASTALQTNEQVNFTDPPNSAAMGSQNSVLVQENPTGYGCWGSIAAGELLLIKKFGGGVLVSGDISGPEVTRLQGVVGTGGILGLGASTPLGFFYASNDNGVWVWNGGNTAQKASRNLNDDFFAVPTAGGIAACICAQGDLVYCSNDWVYDTVTGGWWRLTEAGTGNPDLYMLPTGDGAGVWALPSAVSYAAGTPVVATQYSYNTPAAVFAWQSYPMQESIFKAVIVREVVVRAQGVGTVTVVVTGRDGATSISSPTSEAIASVDQPTLYRFIIGRGPSGGALVANDVTVQVVSTGAPAGTPDNAPTPHNGTVTGAPTVVDSPWAGFGNAASFSGVPSTDGIDCGAWNAGGVPAVSGVGAAAAFTLEARIKSGGDSDPICGWASADQPPQLWCNGTGGTWAFYATDNLGAAVDVEAGVVDGLPHVLAVDYDGVTVRLYLDGAMIASALCTGIHAYTADDHFRIGSDDNANYIGAVIDEVRWSNVARYASDGGYSVADAPFVADANTLALYHLDVVQAAQAPAPVIYSISTGWSEQLPASAT